MKRCRKQAAPKSKVCHSCRMKAYKEKYPVRYAYQVLKNNAKRRGKSFTLTFEEFQKFCYETEVLHARGRTSSSFHIDRIDDTKGYTMDNIQVLTNAANVAKENRRRKIIRYDHQYKFGFMMESRAHLVQSSNEVPF
jgi:hypothetical protein